MWRGGSYTDELWPFAVREHQQYLFQGRVTQVAHRIQNCRGDVNSSRSAPAVV